MQRFALGGFAALLALAGCTTETGGPSKEQYATDVATGAIGGKADHADFCEELDWYGDGICDWFCPHEDQDCTGAECTVGVHSTCAEGQNCEPGVCPHWCDASDPDCCEPASCEWPSDFCLRVLCGPGTVCDPERAECVPVESDFCPRALCGPGTVCDEEEDRCVPIGDDCSPVLCELYCPYGFQTDEDGCGICRCAEPPEPTCPPTGVLCDPECGDDGRTPGGAPCNRGVWNDETCTCDPVPPPAAECVRGGCSSQLCVPAGGPPVFTTCEWRPEYACIQQQICERQADGSCGFTDTEASDTCFAEL